VEIDCSRMKAIEGTTKCMTKKEGEEPPSLKPRSVVYADTPGMCSYIDMPDGVECVERERQRERHPTVCSGGETAFTPNECPLQSRFTMSFSEYHNFNSGEEINYFPSDRVLLNEFDNEMNDLNIRSTDHLFFNRDIMYNEQLMFERGF